MALVRASVIAFGVTFLCCAAAHAGQPSLNIAMQPRIQSSSDMDSYLATTPPGVSPLDRLSAPAKSRFLMAFRNGRPSTSELVAELTREEALAVLSLFGYEAFVPQRLRTKHRSIGASESPAVTGYFEEFQRAIDGGDVQKAGAVYSRRLSPSQTAAALKLLSDGNVALYFRAADSLAEADPDSTGKQDSLLDLSELEHRGVAATGWVEQTYRTLITSRDFDGARAFRSRHNDAALPPTPAVREEVADSREPTVLALNPDGSLVHRPADINRGSRIVVIAGCHFSKDAARDIESDADLKSVFERHSAWVAPAQSDPTDPDLIQWNRDHPAAEMTTAYRQSEWAGFDVWAIPTFYFLKDGRIEAKVVGWQDQKSAVLDGLSKIGLVSGEGIEAGH